MKEKTKDFKETFVKAKEPESFHIALEGTHHDALDKIVKSLIISDFSFQN